MTNSLLKQTTQAAVLSITSNVLAQALTAYREDKPFALDLPPIIRFTIFTLLNTPPNILWQHYLEERFPGNNSPSTTTAIEPLSKDEQQALQDGLQEDGEKRKSDDLGRTATSVAQKKTEGTNVGNILKKFLLDQTIAALVNTVLFVAAIRGMAGAGRDEIVQAVRTETFPLMSAGWKLWPFVSLLCFAVIPLDKRVLFGGTVGLFWGIYVSMVMS